MSIFAKCNSCYENKKLEIAMAYEEYEQRMCLCMHTDMHRPTYKHKHNFTTILVYDSVCR
jgi:hypothetical protein